MEVGANLRRVDPRGALQCRLPGQENLLHEYLVSAKSQRVKWVIHFAQAWSSPSAFSCSSPDETAHHNIYFSQLGGDFTAGFMYSGAGVDLFGAC